MKRGDKVRLKLTPILAPSCGGSVYMDENPGGTIVEVRGEYARVRWGHSNSFIYRVLLADLEKVSR